MKTTITTAATTTTTTFTHTNIFVQENPMTAATTRLATKQQQ